MKKRKILNFAKYREANTENFFTCPLCEEQAFLIRSDEARICIRCDVIVEGHPPTIVEFKK